MGPRMLRRVNRIKAPITTRIKRMTGKKIIGGNTVCPLYFAVGSCSRRPPIMMTLPSITEPGLKLTLPPSTRTLPPTPPRNEIFPAKARTWPGTCPLTSMEQRTQLTFLTTWSGVTLMLRPICTRSGEGRNKIKIRLGTTKHRGSISCGFLGGATSFHHQRGTAKSTKQVSARSRLRLCWGSGAVGVPLISKRCGNEAAPAEACKGSTGSRTVSSTPRSAGNSTSALR